MPWRCPACQVPIRHSDSEDAPRRGARYRCHICRLELMLDEATDRLTVTPLYISHDNPVKRRDDE